MPRLRLEPLESYPFSVSLAVRTTDLNYRGHLGNDRLVALVHEARVAFLAHHGFSESDCAGVALILADTAVVYRGEAFAGDVLLFEVAAAEPGSRGFRLFFRVTDHKTGDTVALVENGVVCFDYQKRSTVPLPGSLGVLFSS